jgi:hypothetical protein
MRHAPWPGAFTGTRRLLQDPQTDPEPDEPADSGTPDPDAPHQDYDPDLEDPGAPAPVGDFDTEGVTQESPDLLHGACTNRSEMLRSACSQCIP